MIDVDPGWWKGVSSCGPWTPPLSQSSVSSCSHHQVRSSFACPRCLSTALTPVTSWPGNWGSEHPLLLEVASTTRKAAKVATHTWVPMLWEGQLRTWLYTGSSWLVLLTTRCRVNSPEQCVTAVSSTHSSTGPLRFFYYTVFLLLPCILAYEDMEPVTLFLIVIKYT